MFWARCRQPLACCLAVAGPIFLVAANTNTVNVNILALTGQTSLRTAYLFEITGWGASEPNVMNAASSLNFGQVISSPKIAPDHAEITADINHYGADPAIFAVLTNNIRLTANTVGIACGEKHTLLLKRDGTVQAVGSPQSGQANVPPGLTGVIAVAAGTDHSLALTSEGKVISWGWNRARQVSVPADLANVAAIAAGRDYSLALLADGSVRAWGHAPEGSGEDPDKGGHLEPPSEIGKQVPIPIVAIAAGVRHALALRANGSIVGWGEELDQLAWTPPTGSGPFTAISAGMGFSVGLRPDGTVQAWGDNRYQQLEIPDGLAQVVALACGNYHTLALRADGTVVAWGNNAAGQTAVPLGTSNVVAVAAGGFHCEILQHDGPLLFAPRVFNGQFSCELGLPAGRRYRLQASTDLVQWNTVDVGTAYPTRMTWEGPARDEGYVFYRVKTIWPGQPGYVSVFLHRAAISRRGR